MTKEEMAALLNGREYGEEITKAEKAQAKESGLVVVFGYSDDNTEFRGAFDDEVGGCGDHSLFVTKEGVLEPHDVRECECAYCGYADAKAKAKQIKAVWDNGEYSWTYETMIPHSTFDILEDGEKFCRGIVFSVKDL